MSTDTKSPSYNNPEVWGGVECTINRVGDRYRDQLDLSGHYTREGDIERFAALGIRKLRYPVLWERHQQQASQKIDWSWSKKQLELIRKNHMVPIAGLLHHGSGPRFTDLSDDEFPVKFADYARQVAKKFPWLVYYTPVNEPLTTARFSGLYGLWFPHHKNERSFFNMLLNQLKATVLAMQAIREINPVAQLVQTEDLTKVHSSPLLTYQADFENQRRWLTYDLLCGKVNPEHFFWKYLIQLGFPVSTLEFFLDNVCPPAVLGCNYYVTSERYLDELVENFDPRTHGTNGLHVYADTDAVRAGIQDGLTRLLKETWDRYTIPIAITECHLSCTREEQMRWVRDTWNSCRHLLHEGIPVKGITVWSLLGAYDWNSLLTAEVRSYESGVFDVRTTRVRETLLAKMISSLSQTGNFDHPLIDGFGWWHKKENITAGNEPKILQAEKIDSPVLIVGKTGTLGQAFQRICDQRSIKYIGVGRDEIDILDEPSIINSIKQYKPWAIINTVGYVRVDEAEAEPDSCFAINATAPALMARLCQKFNIRFMSFSSDLVFDGGKKSPYNETDKVSPLNVYGSSKAEAEHRILAENPASLIIRTSAFFGPWDKHNFAYHVLEALKHKQSLALANDVVISPTYLPDLCHMALDLFIDEEKGIWHLSNDGIITWAEFGGIIAQRMGYKKHTLISRPAKEMGWKARRPVYSALQSDRGIKLPPFENALTRFFEQDR